MSDLSPRVAEAIETVAQNVLRNTVHSAIKDGRVEWGNYPELSEADWERVSFRALEMADVYNTTHAAFMDAYRLLSERAGELS